MCTIQILHIVLGKTTKFNESFAASTLSPKFKITDRSFKNFRRQILFIICCISKFEQFLNLVIVYIIQLSIAYIYLFLLVSGFIGNFYIILHGYFRKLLQGTNQ